MRVINNNSIIDGKLFMWECKLDSLGVDIESKITEFLSKNEGASAKELLEEYRRIIAEMKLTKDGS